MDQDTRASDERRNRAERLRVVLERHRFGEPLAGLEVHPLALREIEGPIIHSYCFAAYEARS